MSVLPLLAFAVEIARFVPTTTFGWLGSAAMPGSDPHLAWSGAFGTIAPGPPQPRMLDPQGCQVAPSSDQLQEKVPGPL